MNNKMAQHAAPLARSCAPETLGLVVDGEVAAFENGCGVVAT